MGVKQAALIYTEQVDIDYGEVGIAKYLPINQPCPVSLLSLSSCLSLFLYDMIPTSLVPSHSCSSRTSALQSSGRRELPQLGDRGDIAARLEQPRRHHSQGYG